MVYQWMKGDSNVLSNLNNEELKRTGELVTDTSKDKAKPQGPCRLEKEINR